MTKKTFIKPGKNLMKFFKHGIIGISSILIASSPNFAFAQDSNESVLAPEPNIKVDFGPETVLFSAFGEDYTAADYSRIIRYSPPSSLGRPDIISFSLYEYDNAEVIDSIKQYLIQIAALDAANEYGFTATDQEEEALDRNSNRILQFVWLEKNGVLDPVVVNDADVEKKYNEMKDLRYKIAEELHLQHIFFSTYTDYVVEEGDSLESIAEKINGDKTKVDLILSKEPPRKARNEPELDKDGNEVPPKALVAGETLMVPMNDEDAKEVEVKAFEAYEKLQADAVFADIAEEYADNQSKGNPVVIKPADQEKPILESFRNTFESLNDESVSEPFRTKHGFQIMKRIKYIEPGYRPLTDEIRDRLANEIQIDKTNERYYSLLERLMNEYDGFEIDAAVLEDVLNPELKDEVIIQVKDVKYTPENYIRDFHTEFDKDTPLEERISKLAKLPMVGRALSEWEISRSNLKEDESFQVRAEILRGTLMAQKYYQYLLDEVHPFDPTDEEIAAHYQEIQDIIAQLPATELHQITLYPEEEVTDANRAEIVQTMQQDLGKALEGVDTLEKFKEVARQISEDNYAEAGGYVGKINAFYEDNLAQNFLKGQYVDAIYGPVQMKDSRVAAFWVGEINEAGNISLEEARDNIIGSLKQVHEAEVQGLMEVYLRDRAQFELKIEP